MTNRIGSRKLFSHLESEVRQLNGNINEGYYSFSTFVIGSIDLYSKFQPLMRFTRPQMIKRQYESEEV